VEEFGESAKEDENALERVSLSNEKKAERRRVQQQTVLFILLLLL
jgi:hypothetical protein